MTGRLGWVVVERTSKQSKGASVRLLRSARPHHYFDIEYNVWKSFSQAILLT